MKLTLAMIALVLCLSAQNKSRKGTTKMTPIRMSRCAEPIAAYGEHVRFTAEDILQMHANQEKQHGPYREWELAAATLNWLDGTQRVPLATIKSHMPRAMLLTLRFPVDQHPPVVAEDLQRLLKAELEYNQAVESTKDFFPSLMKKYGIGPQAIFDQDMGGATPMAGCARYEEYDYMPEAPK